MGAAVISPEMELLVACARVRLEAADVLKIRRLAGGQVDWERLLALAVPHGMLPLLHLHLEEVRPEGLPEPVMDRLREHFQNTARRNLRLTMELLGILDLLKAHGIPAVPFKGPAQAVSVLGKLALREFVDLDLLLHRRDALRARDLLSARGYGSRHRFTRSQEKAYQDSRGEYYLYRPTDGTRVEIHWKLLPDYFAIPLDLEGIWSRLGSLSLGDATVPALAPEDLLLLLCIHGYSHMWERLEWICGVAELIRQRREMEWGMVLRQARELGAERILLLGLEMAGGLLGAPLPAEVIKSMRGDPEVARLADRVRGRLVGWEAEPAGIREIIGFQLSCRERFRDRVRLLLRVTTTSTVEEWSAVSLPDALFPLYRLVRPVALARKYLLGGSVSNGRSLSEG